LRTIYFKRKDMKININHPTFLAFLDNVIVSITSSVNISNYFKLSQDKKMGVLYMVYKLIKKSIQITTKLSDTEMKSFVTVLWKKCEESENYELAAILNDINNNFDAVNEFSKPLKRKRTISVDNIKNEKE
jgi:predicted nucleic-acid-binding Zn-ribbon protein